MKIAAVIVTYNPDIALLVTNIEAVMPQVKEVLVVDNHSENIDAIRAALPVNTKIHVEKKNVGIAKATNDGIKMHETNGFNWVLTLDQDSTVLPDYISQLVDDEDNGVGMFAPIIRNQYEMIKNHHLNLLNAQLIDNVLVYDDVYDAAFQVIASGAVINVEAWRGVGGMDEYLFIDRVDFDFNMKLLLNKYLIVQKNVLLNHNLGYSFSKKIFSKNITTMNHSAFRKYFIFRNGIIMGYRYGNKSKELKNLWRQFIAIVLIEDHKVNKIFKSLKGVGDALVHEIRESIHFKKN